jgi:glycosyltransferase involved in cell wall biosynthesis
MLRRVPDFDVVHTQHSSGSLYGLFKNKFRKPWIVSFHEHQFRRLLTYLDLKPWRFSVTDSVYYALGYPLFDLMTQAEKTADHYIVCGTAGLADYLSFSKIDAAKTTMIRNGIDLEKIQSIIGKEESDKDSCTSGLTLFTCGRLHAAKGVEYLVRAMPRVASRYRNVRLKIFGKGPMEPALRNMIRSLHLDKVVSLEGYVPYDRLVHEMNRCDLAIYPTLLEVGASIAIMEAMACHKSVVAFDYPFTRDVITHMKTGYLVPRKNPVMLADAIALLLQDNSLRKRLGDNAFDYIVRNHDYKKIIKKYVEVYSSQVADRCN